MDMRDKIELSEIQKWTSKLEAAMPEVTSNGVPGDSFLANIKAYQLDSKHFLEKQDLVYSFEAIVWAWAWLESGVEAGVLSCPSSLLSRID